MPAEANNDVLSFWQQISVLIGIGAAAAAAAVQSYRSGRKEEAAPKHVVLEQAEIADMSVLRQLLQRYDAVLELKAQVDEQGEDLREIRATNARIEELLKRMDQEAQMRRIFREERGRHGSAE